MAADTLPRKYGERVRVSKCKATVNNFGNIGLSARIACSSNSYGDVMQPNNRMTWRLLLDWGKGPTDGERFSAELLELEGFYAIDPTHPLGGPDCLKDLVLKHDGKRWIAAAHFANGEKQFSTVRKKYTDDLKGVAKNNADGFVFITNQSLSLTDRHKLEEIAGTIPCELYHLERLRNILDSLRGVPLRQKYLGIPVSSDELVAAVGRLDRFDEMLSAAASKALSSELPRTDSLELPGEGEFSYADLAVLAKAQNKSEMHRAYEIDSRLLPAFASPEVPIPPIILLDEFPEDFASCHKTAHEVAMLLFFLQRSIGLAHVERLSSEMRKLITRVVERLWRSTVRLRPLIVKCQFTFLMVGANRLNSSCAHYLVYMSASHFLQELLQATEQIGYSIASDALSNASEGDELPYDQDQILAKWPGVVNSLRNNLTIRDGFQLLSTAYYDLSAEAARAARYEKGMPIIPAWMIVKGASETL
ncbi:MAG: hypothetical protein AB7G28_04915 [Pirellulales bacterium]